MNIKMSAKKLALMSQTIIDLFKITTLKNKIK